MNKSDFIGICFIVVGIIGIISVIIGLIMENNVFVFVGFIFGLMLIPSVFFLDVDEFASEKQKVNDVE